MMFFITSKVCRTHPHSNVTVFSDMEQRCLKNLSDSARYGRGFTCPGNVPRENDELAPSRLFAFAGIPKARKV